MAMLAYADASDSSAANLRLIFVGLVLIGGVALLASVPVWAAWRRKHPHLEILAAAMLIWTIALGWSSISLMAARGDWEKEKTLRVESGYDSNPTDSSAPQPPILFWSTLAGSWLLVNCWAFLMPVRLMPTSQTPVPSDGTLQRSEEPLHSGAASESNDLLSS